RTRSPRLRFSPLRVSSPRVSPRAFAHSPHRPRSSQPGLLLGDLILLQLSIRHLVGPRAQRLISKPDHVDAKSHSTAQTLEYLLKIPRRSKRRKTSGKVLQRLLAEIRVGVVSEKRTIDRAVLQSVEDLLRLLEPRAGSGIVAGQQERCDASSDLP